MSEYEVGDEVLFSLGAVDYERYATPGMRHWDGCRFKVRAKRVLTVQPNNRYITYELERCISPKGIPYTILPEWLTLIRGMRG